MGDVVRIRVRGHSMRPSLRDGDELDVVLGAPIVAGDVVLFMEGATAVLHRVLSIRDGRVLTQGDGAARPDAPFAETRVLGVARVPRRRALAMWWNAIESARAIVRTMLGRRGLAMLRIVRSFALLAAIVAVSGKLFVAAASGGEAPLIAPPTSAPPDEIGLQLQIDNLTDLIRALPEGDRKAGEMIALADAYRERALVNRARGDAEERRWWDEHGEAVREAIKNGAPQPKLAGHPLQKLADVDFKKAIAIYEHVTKKYPSHARSEHALEQLVLSYLDISEIDKASTVLLRLAARDPSSQALARSYVAVARVLQERRPADALGLYERAATIADPTLAEEIEHGAAACRAATAHAPGGPRP